MLQPLELHDSPRAPFLAFVAMDAARELFAKTLFKSQFEAYKVESTQLTTAESGCVLRVPFTVTQCAMNGHGTLHGGVAVWLADVINSMHLTAESGSTQHVSVNLHASFLKAVPGESRVVVRSRLVKVGKTMAFLTAQIESTCGSTVFVTVTHAKSFVGRPKL